MKYCENGDHRFHVRPKLVEQSCGDSGWLCAGEKGWTPLKRKKKRKKTKR